MHDEHPSDPAGQVPREPQPGTTPLHRQISDELRRQIGAGDLRPGDLLPSEHTLMSRYGVSRGTVRQALAALRADGTIAGSQGRQLAVRGPHLTQPLSELVSFSAWIRSLGKRPSGQVVEFGPRPANEELAARLGVPVGSSVHHLLRLRFADGEPLLIERTTFPPAIGEKVAGLNLAEHSIYAELARQGIVFASARHIISALPATGIDARLLHVSPGTALLRIYRQAFSRTGEPLEWADDRYPADRVDFAVESSANVSGMVRRLERLEKN